MLSNAYFVAKFRFGTDENEPAKNLQKFANFANSASAFSQRWTPGARFGVLAREMSTGSSRLGCTWGSGPGRLPGFPDSCRISAVLSGVMLREEYSSENYAILYLLAKTMPSYIEVLKMCMPVIFCCKKQYREACSFLRIFT